MDWEAVRRTARARSGERRRIGSERAARLAGVYDGYAAGLAPLMAEVCGPMPEALPRFTVLDRTGFIDTNLVILRRLVEPVERIRAGLPETGLTAIGRRLTSRYMGELLGLMSQRVLGQFDPVLTLPGPMAGEREPRSLYLVEPNVEQFQRAHQIPEEPLRRWLILHEATHAWQFEAHPWLGPHIGELMNGLVMSGLVAEVSRSERGGLDLDSLRRLGGTLSGQLRGLARVQALMSVLEGYSNFVMHRVRATSHPRVRGPGGRLRAPPDRAQPDRASDPGAERHRGQAAPVPARRELLRRGCGRGRDRPAQPGVGGT